MTDRTETYFALDDAPDLRAEVRAARAAERLSVPYEVTLELAVEVELEVDQILGRGATLTLEQAPLPPRTFAGVVWEARSSDGPLADGRAGLTLTLRPALSALSLNRTSRIFQATNVPDILQEVLEAGLSAHGRELRVELGADYLPREFCVQYQESDFDFASRLMEEEGIFYSFEHPGPGEPEVLVLHDAHRTLPEIAGGEAYGLDASRRVVHERVVRSLERRAAASTNALAVSDHDWTGPRAITAEASGEAAFPVLEAYEHGLGRSATITSYDDGARRYQADDAARIAAVRLEERAVLADSVAGASIVSELVAGGRLTVSGHPSPGLDGEWVLLEVVHELRDGGRGDAYHNRFVGLPMDGPTFRPPRRATKPRIGSALTAVVAGPAGEEIHTDAHARIKVAFHWDRDAPGDDRSSCWLRIRQAWAGDGWGFLFVPRIGMHVAVSFLGGDPDRPLVTGCLSDGEHAPPYPLPDEKTKSTIKTNSSPGGGGFNEVRFEDLAGQEQIYVHAQRDFDELVKNDHSTWVGGDQTNEVTGDQLQTIGDWQKEEVDANQEMYVTGHRKVDVGGDFKETIDTGEDRVVKGGSKETIKAGETRLIVGPSDEKISGSEGRTVNDGMTEVVLGPLTLDITGTSTRTETGDYDKVVTGALTVSTPGANVTVTAGTEVVLDAGGPITASGAPLIQLTCVNRVKLVTTMHYVGILKYTLLGLKGSTYPAKFALGGYKGNFAGVKVEGVHTKIAWGGTKKGLTGAKLEIGVVKLSAKGLKDLKSGIVIK